MGEVVPWGAVDGREVGEEVIAFVPDLPTIEVWWEASAWTWGALSGRCDSGTSTTSRAVFGAPDAVGYAVCKSVARLLRHLFRRRAQGTGHRQRERPYGRPAQFANLCKSQPNNSKPTQQETGRRTPSSELTDESLSATSLLLVNSFGFRSLGAYSFVSCIISQSSFRTVLASKFFLPTSIPSFCFRHQNQVISPTTARYNHSTSSLFSSGHRSLKSLTFSSAPHLDLFAACSGAGSVHKYLQSTPFLQKKMSLTIAHD